MLSQCSVPLLVVQQYKPGDYRAGNTEAVPALTAASG